MQDAINAFKSLSGKSTVHAIGIGNGVNEGYLKFFDNTNVTGTGSVSLPTGNWWEGYQTVTGPTGQPQIVNTARISPPRCKAARPARIRRLSETTSSTAAPATTSSSAIRSTLTARS